MLKFRLIMAKYLDFLPVGLIALLMEPLIAFFLPISGFIAFAIFSVMMDTATGILASHKNGIPITSKGIWRTIEKIFVSCSAIMVVYAFQITFIPFINLTFGVAMIIAAAEVKSNLENVEKILKVKIWKYVKSKINESEQSGD
jgi:uncharacterized membrane protein